MKFNFSIQATFYGNCEVEADSEEHAREIVNQFLYVSGAKLIPDACADEVKNITDYSIDCHGEVVTMD